MKWEPNASAPKDGRQIIIAAKNLQSKRYEYNIVFYHEPMGLWYGGPGIMVMQEEIEVWSEISPPDNWSG
jgi:hypothetical protein